VSRRQARFEGSDRQARGRLLKRLGQGAVRVDDVPEIVGRESHVARKVVEGLYEMVCASLRAIRFGCRRAVLAQRRLQRSVTYVRVSFVGQAPVVRLACCHRWGRYEHCVPRRAGVHSMSQSGGSALRR